MKMQRKRWLMPFGVLIGTGVLMVSFQNCASFSSQAFKPTTTDLSSKVDPARTADGFVYTSSAPTSALGSIVELDCQSPAQGLMYGAGTGTLSKLTLAAADLSSKETVSAHYRSFLKEENVVDFEKRYINETDSDISFLLALKPIDGMQEVETTIEQVRFTDKNGVSVIRDLRLQLPYQQNCAFKVTLREHSSFQILKATRNLVFKEAQAEQICRKGQFDYSGRRYIMECGCKSAETADSQYTEGIWYKATNSGDTCFGRGIGDSSSYQ